MPDRKVWFIRVSDRRGNTGLGEVAPIDRLSPESVSEIPNLLTACRHSLEKKGYPSSQEEVFRWVDELVPYTQPSIRFGLEMALLDLINGGNHHIFNHQPEKIDLPINGLIWMGDISFMQHQIKEKLDQGFRCIKLKVGAQDFESERELIKKLRQVSEELVIRLDANGAFGTHEVLAKLKLLSTYNIHSIEQPILPAQPEAMELVCAKSEIPIALDEELIHVFTKEEKEDLLRALKPQYLVLKPTLHGGFASVAAWIALAEAKGIKWWVTSYLESNLGLNAIAQFASMYKNKTYHGLGTGGLYHNNLVSPIVISDGRLSYAQSSAWGPIDF